MTKPKSPRNSTKRKEKPLPDTVLQRLEKKKLKLQKKIDKAEKEKQIKSPRAYKKRQKSYQYGIENLSTAIEETKEELEKRLKKMPVPEDLKTILDEEGKAAYKRDLADRLRKLAESRVKREEPGDDVA